MNIIKGDLLQLAKEGKFDVIAHGCNCQNVMGAGIAAQVQTQFPDAFEMDRLYHEQVGKFKNMMMGNYSAFYFWEGDSPRFYILNLYTQLEPGIASPGCPIPFDYEAFTTCLRKINQEFSGKRIGIPWIGCGLAGGDKIIVQSIIEDELTNMEVTIVEYENNKAANRRMAKSGLGNASSEGETVNSKREAAGPGYAMGTDNYRRDETWKAADQGTFLGYGEED